MNKFYQFTLFSSVLTLAGTTFADSQLEEMTVTASRTEVPLRQVGASLSIMTAEQIEQRGHHTVADVLRSMPGINVSNSGGPGKQTALRIRGEESFRTKVLIDGVDISDPTTTQVQPHMEHILSANIERIEVLSGPQGMMYGADSGGVINIITKKAEESVQGDAAFEYGRYDTENMSGNVRGKFEKFDYSLMISDINTEGFNAKSTDTTDRDDDGYENRTLGFSGGLNLSDALRIQLQVRDINAESEFDTCGFPSTNDCVSHFDQTNYKTDILYEQGSLEHQLSYAHTDTARKNVADKITKTLDTEGELEQIQYIGNFRSSKILSFLYGLDWEKESLDNSLEQFERNQKGAYVEGQINIADSWFFTTGVRHDDNDDFGEHTSYRLTSAYIVPTGSAGNIKFRASAGTGFRAPSLYESAYNSGPYASPPASAVVLTEETSEGFDIGVEFHGNNGLYLAVTYFDQAIEDEIMFDDIFWSGYLQNSGKSDSTGAELAFDIPISGFLSVFGNYIYNDTENPDGEQRVRRPRNVVNLGFSLRLFDERLQLTISGRSVEDSIDRIYNLTTFSFEYVPLDDYESVDFNLSYKLSESVDLYVRGENILGEDYQEATDYNTSGAATYGGVRIHF